MRYKVCHQPPTFQYFAMSICIQSLAPFHVCTPFIWNTNWRILGLSLAPSVDSIIDFVSTVPIKVVCGYLSIDTHTNLEE